MQKEMILRLAGWTGMMAYKTIAAEKPVQKFIHMLLHLIAICMGIIGIHAVLKFHNKENIEDFYSLHSWVGIATFSIFLLQVKQPNNNLIYYPKYHVWHESDNTPFINGSFTLLFFWLVRILQWLVGFVLFMFPKASPGTRARALPWHICGGRALLYMAISSALTGLMEKATLLGDKYHSNQARTINFLGLSILLFGIFVDFSLVFARYVWFLLFCRFLNWIHVTYIILF